ncbi:MAG: tetratricopeptide repeat protein [Longimicrobiales bacterium]
MIDPHRVLQPLDDVGAAVRRLHDYQNPVELAAALRDVVTAVEQCLRGLLRADPGAPDELRLSALSATQLPTDRVVDALRQRDRISIELAGSVHELQNVRARISAGDVHATDADAALRTVELLRAELGQVAEVGALEAAQPSAPGDVPESDATAIAEPGGRGLRWLAVGLAAIVIVAVLWLLLAGGDPYADGLAAFEQGRMGVAEQHLQQAVEDEPDNVTARLYLARIHRRQERYEAAAEQLRAAAASAPQDADVRRELGHLLFELRRYDSAAEQYRQALELDPDGTMNWVGLIRALRASGDPRADDLLADAPADVRAALAGDAPEAREN